MSGTGNSRSNRSSRPPLLQAYITIVVLAAVGGLLVLFFFDPTPTRVDTLGYLLLAVYVVASEVFPLRVIRDGREGLLTVSTSFAFAILLRLGALETILPLVVGSVLHDLLQRKTLQRAVFNAAQLTVSVVAAGAALQAVAPRSGDPPFLLAETGLLGVVAAALAFFAAHFVLSGLALALASNISPLTLLRRDLAPQAGWTAVLLSVSPIIVATAETSAALMPLFAVLMALVYRSMDVV